MGQAAYNVLIVVLLINVAVAIYLHYQEKLTIYTDYTDAAITTASMAIPILLFYIFVKFFGMNRTFSLIVNACFFLVIFAFVIRSTYLNNEGFMFFLMSLLAKYSLVTLFIVIIAFLVSSVGSSRRKGETRRSYQARQRRETVEGVAAVGIVSAIFAYVSHLISRERDFAPIGDYFRLKPKEDLVADDDQE